MASDHVDVDTFYPVDLLEEYKSITVTTPRGSTTIAVNKYRCRNPAYGGTVGPEEVKDGFLNVSKRAIIQEAGGAVPLVNVFVGKGSVDEFATVLALVDKYKDNFVKTFKKYQNTQGACARMMEGYRDDQWAEMLQAFSDSYLGLDCNGFVGNYTRRTRMSPLGPSEYPSAYYYRHIKHLRKAAADVANCDILVWANFQHIAIIDTVLQLETATRVKVCQSTAGGPQESWHNLVATKAKNGLYTLDPSGKVGGYFFVLGLDEV